MSIGLQIARAVAKELDHDDVYARAQTLGNQAVRLKPAQISGLESIANGSRKVSDVLNYVKLRTARHKEWQADQLGANLLHEIEQQLRRQCDGICSELAPQLSQNEERQRAYIRQDIYMRLIRGFVAQVAAQYAYAKMLQERKAKDGAQPD
ncbi:MAG: hypothetical protein EI684_17335 [Candidatus Viridilinea halotolerans]|uniref:CRISPR type III-B/RAMP module-associated protein Cmr5 n=1 Tax=Candidatus Viridilinea halotolerans TaxID=2491704 RepID=A0A426TU88_9CHLR|nr:MAG: hypothetical protein EI684_17335 [Candidatus Viridilinea halotolerans]